MNADFLFILSLLAINFIVFLPHFIIGVLTSNNTQKTSILKEKPYFLLKAIFYQRFNNDFFRLLTEIQLLVLLVLLFKTPLVFFKVSIIIISILGLIYTTYISAITSIFKKEPILINDLDFIKTGIMVYRTKARILFLILAVSVVGLIFIFNFLTNHLISNLPESSSKWYISLVIVISISLSIFLTKRLQYNYYISAVHFSFVAHLFTNLKKSITLKKSLKTLKQNNSHTYINTIELEKKPNIICIPLESYGSFAFNSKNESKQLIDCLNTLNTDLKKQHWKSVSTFSESPVYSGGSWVSHSSILFGTKVNDLAAHELIFSKTEYVSHLESLPKLFSNLNYNTVNTATISYKPNEVNWEKVRNAYPFSKMMLIEDFNYKGKYVPIFGNRESLPDQYTLNFAYNEVKEQSPFFLFVNTTNSHHNFISPLNALENWKDYNNLDFKLTDGLKKHSVKNYFASINYHFDYLKQFILNEKHDDTIFILFGDHQPPFITPKNSDYTTPIHIISKNTDVIKAFEMFNYSEGLVPIKKTQTHESFFSKFIYALNKGYGKNKSLETPIFENGINLY